MKLKIKITYKDDLIESYKIHEYPDFSSVFLVLYFDDVQINRKYIVLESIKTIELER